MSYKTELQNNNTRLRGVVDKINALPDYVEPAPGGGGSMVNISASGSIPKYDRYAANVEVSITQMISMSAT